MDCIIISFIIISIVGVLTLALCLYDSRPGGWAHNYGPIDDSYLMG